MLASARRCPTVLSHQTCSIQQGLIATAVSRANLSTTSSIPVQASTERASASPESILVELAHDFAEARHKGNGSRIFHTETDIRTKLPTVEQGVICGLLNTHHLVQSRGWKVAGYKIGATSEAAQKANGLSKPFWGALYWNRTSNALENYNERISLSDDLVRGVEAEFAVTLKKDIPTGEHQRRERYTAEELRAEYLDTVGPAIEVCASRAPKNAGPYAPMLIADGAGNGCVILGPSRTFVKAQEVKDLPGKTTQISIDGVVVASGSGKAVMGNPFESMAWFVNEIMDLKDSLYRPAIGPELLKGQYVITGATCGLIPVTKPAYVKVKFNRWGEDESDWSTNLAIRQN